MAKKPTVTTVSSGFASNTQLNSNFTALRDAFDNTLSLDGSTPNAMQADIDLNNNDLLNAGVVNTATLKVGGVSVVPSSLTTQTLKKEFETVAELLADTGTYVSYAAGDYFRVINGGFAYQVAASGASDHHLTTTGGVKLYVLPDASGYNVKAFGAKGDGVTNDNTAMQAAIAAVSAAGGGTVYVPTGTYILTAPLTVSSYTQVVGESRFGSVLNFVGCSGITSADGNQHIAIKRLYILGNDTAATYGVRITNNPRGVVLEELFVRRFGGNSDNGAGVRLENSTTFNMWGSQISSVVVEDGARGFDLVNANATSLVNCVSRLNFSHAIRAEGCSSLNIIGGAYENTQGATTVSPVYGIFVTGCQNFTLSGLWSENTPSSLLFITGSLGGTIDGCLFNNITSAGPLVAVGNSSRQIIFNGVRIKSLGSGDTGISVDATCTEIDTSGVYFETVLGGSTTASIATGSRPNLSANQIAFDAATLTFSAASWTPVVRGSSTAGTYELATASGEYVKVGRVVIATCKIVAAGSVTGGGTGFISVVLPLAYAAGNIGLCASVRVEGLSFTGSFVATERATTSSDTRLLLTGISNTGVNTFIPISAFVANAEIDLTVTYLAAS